MKKLLFTLATVLPLSQPLSNAWAEGLLYFENPDEMRVTKVNLMPAQGNGYASITDLKHPYNLANLFKDPQKPREIAASVNFAHGMGTYMCSPRPTILIDLSKDYVLTIAGLRCSITEVDPGQKSLKN
jgi:hypothetical protein